jgi:hypothetical protein
MRCIAWATSSFPVPGFPQNEHGRFTGSHGCDLVEHLIKGSTVSNDLGKLSFGLCVSLKVASFLSESLLEQFDFSSGAIAFDRYRQLGRYLIDQLHVFRAECIWARASENNNS